MHVHVYMYMYISFRIILYVSENSLGYILLQLTYRGTVMRYYHIYTGNSVYTSLSLGLNQLSCLAFGGIALA